MVKEFAAREGSALRSLAATTLGRMTARAVDRGMAAGEGEPQRRMLRDAERARLPTGRRVARRTGAGGAGGELPAVRVGVARLAAVGPRPHHDFTLAARSRGPARVTTRAGHRRVPPFERVRRAGMLRHGERGRRVAVHGVTRAAVRRRAGDRRLPLVRVGMTARARRERRPVDACRIARVARHAGDRRVLPTQRIPRAIVRERAAFDRRKARRRVATRTCSVQTAGVRITMARDAVDMRHRLELSGQLLVTGRAHRRFDVALLAGDVGVLAGERILRLRVIELGRRRPVGRRVAALARLPQRAPVDVLVARRARRLESDPSGRAALRAEARRRRHAEVRWYDTSRTRHARACPRAPNRLGGGRTAARFRRATSPTRSRGRRDPGGTSRNRRPCRGARGSRGSAGSTTQSLCGTTGSAASWIASRRRGTACS